MHLQHRAASRLITTLLLFLLTGYVAVSAIPTQAIPGQTSLKPGVFLIATENLNGSSFEKTVIFITQYSDKGALGVAINRPSAFKLIDLVPDINSALFKQSAIFLGGPVHPKSIFFLKNTPGGPGVTRVIDGVFAGGGSRALKDLLDKKQYAGTLRTYAGYSGWYPGQLETEVGRGDWKTIEADGSLVFSSDTSGLWQKLSSATQGQWI